MKSSWDKKIFYNWWQQLCDQFASAKETCREQNESFSCKDVARTENEFQFKTSNSFAFTGQRLIDSSKELGNCIEFLRR
jgi:hypothetical protein